MHEGADPRRDRGAAGGLRHDGGRARVQAVGRREAAHGDRARHPQEPAAPDPRRGDVEPRRALRGARAGGAGDAPRRAHEPRHRAPPEHDPRRRPHPRARQRAGSSSRARTPSCSPRAVCTRASTSSSSAPPRTPQSQSPPSRSPPSQLPLRLPPPDRAIRKTSCGETVWPRARLRGVCAQHKRPAGSPEGPGPYRFPAAGPKASAPASPSRPSRAR